MADTDVFFKTRQIGDFQQQLLDREIKQQLANAELYKMASGQGLPAAMQIANAIQQARESGDVQRMRDLYDAGKLLEPGIYPGMVAAMMSGVATTPAPAPASAPVSQSTAPTSTTPRQPTQTLDSQIMQELGTLPPVTQYDTKMVDIPAPPAMTPAPVDVLAGTLAAREAAKEAAKTRADLMARQEMEPSLEAAKTKAQESEKNIAKVQSGATEDVSQARSFYAAADRLEQALNETAATGPLLGPIADLAKDPARTNLQSALNEVTLRARTLLQLPASGFSDADREFLQAISGGQYGRAEGYRQIIARLKRMSAQAEENAINKYQEAGQAPTAKLNNPQPASQGGTPIKVNSPEEALSLPKGTPFITPDGRMKVR